MRTPAAVLKQGTDFASGWEVARNLGRERVGRKLFDREAPEHIRGTSRAAEWSRGYKDGLIARAQAALSLVCYNDGSQYVAEHKTGTRAAIVNALALRGIAGDVVITRNGKTHRCGI